MFKKKLIAVAMSITMISVGSFSYAHSGRTDSSGGHRDNKNKSGLGSYHYHCGGYPAHLHNNGGCPYTGGGSSSGTTTSVNNEEKQKRSVGEKDIIKDMKMGIKEIIVHQIIVEIIVIHMNQSTQKDMKKVRLN